MCVCECVCVLVAQALLTLCEPMDYSTRLPRPWDSPDKNTGVGCHFLLQCMKGKSESEVARLCPTFMEFSRPEYWSG